MVISECKRRVADHSFVDAKVIHDFQTMGWHIHFRDGEGNEYPITDTLDVPMSFNSLQQAEDTLHQIGDCPIKIDSLFRFYAK